MSKAGISIKPDDNPTALQLVSSLCHQLKLRYGLIFFTHVLLVIIIFVTLMDRSLSFEWLLFISLIILSSAGLYFVVFSRYKTYSNENVLEHINRTSPNYEESAQLILSSSHHASLVDSTLDKTTDTNSLLRNLQKNKVESLLYSDYKNDRLLKLFPKLKFGWIFVLVIVLFSVVYSGVDLKQLSKYLKTTFIEGEEAAKKREIIESNLEPAIISSTIYVTPPKYTNSKPWKSTVLDLEVVEGSQLEFFVVFSQPNLPYYYSVAGENSQQFSDNYVEKNEHLSDSQFVSDSIYRTKLFEFETVVEDQKKSLSGIHAITMLRDQKPKIEIISPNQTLIEISRNAPAEFELVAKITDDFGISSVKIIASVAKGSGEAVKFRDKSFSFDSSLSKHSENIYQKRWLLSELQMEPGDEVYFSIQAIDNKQPSAQQSRSRTIIVRWLDDEDAEASADGIRIGFVPEYFRSQRQIIIETEKLIDDKRDLPTIDFMNLSAELGHSQSDLKQKYGQYLGDEFGEGPGEQFGLADGYHGGESHSASEASTGLNPTNKDHQHEATDSKNSERDTRDSRNTSTQQTNEHQHGSNQTTEAFGDATALINQFTHDHGSVEIGPMSSRDPKSWMKMAVNEMWQAELHLMLAEPEKALPFEYEAYKYLKLARQAERVYAKRLGFEPPPVTEDRRLTGELEDILEYQLSVDFVAEEQIDQKLYYSAFKILNLSNAKSDIDWNVFNLLSSRLLELSESRPALVKYAVIAQKLYAAKSIELAHCNDCVEQLVSKLWQLRDNPVSRPKSQVRTNYFSPSTEKGYQESVRLIQTKLNGESDD